MYISMIKNQIKDFRKRIRKIKENSRMGISYQF